MRSRPATLGGSPLARLCGRMGVLLAAWFLCARAVAHPVAQGALELEISSGRIEVVVRASQEEMLVSFAHAPAVETDALAHHGRYLLRHLHLSKGGMQLAGVLVSAEDRTGAALPATYRFAFEGIGAGTLVLRQDVLREFDFAPGNPWEASYVVRITRDGREVPGSPLLTVREPLVVADAPAPGGPAVAPSPGVFASYFKHGWHHILGGYDHLLFMCALVLASRRAWELAQVVTVFTAAHTLTIVLAVKGWAHVPSAVVEPMIAVSIVVAALLTVGRTGPVTGRSQLLVAAGFGLFHGLGFAGGLLDALQAGQGTSVAVAVSGFTLGVESGHQLVALPLFGLLVLLRGWGRADPAKGRLVLPLLRTASACVSIAGTFYLVAALRAPHP